MRAQVYGAWLYRGEWDGETLVPMEGWELIRMVPGRFDEPPKSVLPTAGQVTLLMHGETCTVITPD